MHHNKRDKLGRFAPAKKTKKKTTAKKTAAKKRATKKHTIISAMLLDSSGSMFQREDAVISGVNEVLLNARADQKKYNTKNIDILAFFGTVYRECRAPVVELTRGRSGEVQKPGVVGYTSDLGLTALWESTAAIIHRLEDELRTQPKGTKVILTIFTDGGENASCGGWSDGRKIRQLIEEKKAEDWVINFIGMGTQKEIERVATSVGIFGSNVASYSGTSKSTRDVMTKMSQSRSTYTSSVQKGVATNEGFFSDD